MNSHWGDSKGSYDESITFYFSSIGVCQDSCTPNQETAFTLLTGFNVTVSV